MPRFYQTIKAKLIIAFGLFVMLLLVLVASNIWLDSWEAEVEEVALRISFIDAKIHESDKLESVFFTDDAINPRFYEAGESQVLEQRRQVVVELIDALEDLQGYDLQSVIHSGDDIHGAITLFQAYESAFEELVALVKERGFESYGLEGEMRNFIHEIEFAKQPIDLTLLLTLRRHEKDFIIRKDLRYLSRVKRVADELRNNIDAKVKNPEVRDTMHKALDGYLQKFTEFVWVEERIGLSADAPDGLRNKLVVISEALEERLNNVRQGVMGDIATIRKGVWQGSIGVMIVSLIFGVLIALFISSTLGRPISQLSASISQVVQHQFAPGFEVEQIRSKDEIGMLSLDFAYMLRKVRESLEEIRQQSRSIEKKQEALMDSIRYAQQMQHAILPSSEELLRHFAQMFTIYKPQSIVSGDFYWLGLRGDKVFLVLADCTGHGVPGAFMSMIGTTLLNKIVVQHDPQPQLHQALELLHFEVIAALRQHGTRNNDGMDVALCCFERVEGGVQVSFAGAKHNFLYIKDGTLLEIHGTKRSIGGAIGKKTHKPFTTHTFILPLGTRIFLHSDGFPDQHNDEGKKYSTQRLEAFLQTHCDKPFSEMEFLLEDEFERHKGKQHQRDDVTVIGLQL